VIECRIVEKPHTAGLGETVNLIATAGPTDEWGGVLIVAIAILLNVFTWVREWWSDVRYYRARSIVRRRIG